MHRAGQGDHCGVRVVVRLERDDVVPRLDEGKDARREGFGCSGGHQNLGVRVDGQSVVTLLMGRDGLTEGREPGTRRVLIEAGRIVGAASDGRGG